MKIKLTEQEQGLIVEKGNESVDVLEASKKANALSEEIFENDTEHPYVDLGLPSGTLWATCNIGATSPEEAGLYFSWGNVEGHTAEEGYDFSGEDDDGQWKGDYANTPGSSLNGDIPVNATYDAARKYLGSPWQMPSKDDFVELFDDENTYSVFAKANGKKGRLVVSKTNGKSIFIPAAGHIMNSNFSNFGLYGYLWTNSYVNTFHAYSLNFYSNKIHPEGFSFRSNGIPVRPVQKP